MSTVRPRRSAFRSLQFLGRISLLGLAGCGTGWPAVIDPSDIAGIREGTPHIARVRDLGAVHIGQAGPLRAESDGVLTMGELLLIEGSGFGKQPAVGIGNRPAGLRWRTAGGGIVIQVPPGTPAGDQTLWVDSGGQRAQIAVSLQRLAVLLDARRGQLHFVRVGGEAGSSPTAQTAGPPLPLPGAHALAVSSDGAAAYVLQRRGDQDQVAIIDLTAPGGPKLYESRPLGHAAHSLLAAERAPTLVAVGPTRVTVWDVSEARRPTPWRPAELPDAAQAARAAAVDPGGTLLALAVGDNNQLVLVDIKPGRTAVAPRLVGELGVLPQARQPLLRGLRFASDGETLWVTAGDNAESRPTGHQPTRLVAVTVGPPSKEASDDREAGTRPLQLHKTLELRDAGAPLQLTLGRALPVAAGTTIRTPPEKTTLFLTTVSPAAFEHAGRAESALLRSDLAGNATPLLGGKELLSGLDVSPDARLAVAARCAPGPAGLSLTVANLASGATASTTLGPAEAADVQPPFDQVTVLLQP